MKFIKNLKTYINESYRNLDDYDFSDKYERKFANYALNERPFQLNKNEMDECRELYGNKNVGIVYHGGKIDTIELLNILKNLKKGDTYNMYLKSATPDYDTALSFSKYIKSYDELTMITALKDTYERGSSGEYGSYIVKLKPKPEQVIIANFGDGNKPRYSAETECILYGDILVEDIKIFLPLTKDNIDAYINDLSILDCFDSFVKEWMRHHKVKIDKILFTKKFNQINNMNDMTDFIVKYNKSAREFIFGKLKLDELIDNKIFEKLITNINFNSDSATFDWNINGNKISISNIDGLLDYLTKKHQTKLIEYVNKHNVNNVDISIDLTSKYNYGGIVIGDKTANLLHVLVWLNDDKILKNNTSVKKLNDVIVDFINKHILNKTIDDLSDNEINGIENFLTNLQRICSYAGILLINKDIKKGLLYFYNNFFSGKIDNKSAVSKLTYCIKYVLEILQKLNTNMNESYNDFLIRKGYYNDKPFPYLIDGKLIKESEKAYLIDVAFVDENGNMIRKNIWITKTQAHISESKDITLSKWMITKINEANHPLRVYLPFE